MEPRYYDAMIRVEDGRVMLPPGGPLSSYSEVVAVQAERLALQSPAFPVKPPKYESRVLVDLSTVVSGDELELHRLLHDDPVLSAVFKLGQQWAKSRERT